MTELAVTTTATGPVFDGRAAAAAAAYVEEANREIAQAGVNEIQSRLGQVLQNPTGHYSSSVVTDLAQNEATITDGGVVYGPWLEGVSSRNQKSRFRGYSVFRKTVQWLQGRAPDIAESKIRPYLDRMGGS
ncbi:MAG: hypothetical protein EPO65_00630 [Dehalococcoidia bacterium]|nr:MAG: hypothetical protein EPO65_00630 [Dehalococcoidia bacterium]